MSETVTFSIGGVGYKVGPMVIWSLQRCWQSITSLAVIKPNPDMFERTKTYADIVSSALMIDHPDMTQEAILKKITWDEAQELPEKIAELLKVSGFKPKEETTILGEDQATSPSTEIGQGSSPALQPTA